MELYKLENKKYIAFCMVLIVFLLFFRSQFAVMANNGWLTETADGYYSIGNNLEVKVDILNGKKVPIDNNENLFYNGQSVYIRLDWRTTDTVLEGTSLKLELPTNRLNSQIGFESPLYRNVEVISDDSRILTSLKSDGGTLTAFFLADNERPIEKDKSGTIYIPHNIFVTPEANKFLIHTMELLLTGDNGQQKPIRKEISKIDNGIKVDSLALKNKNSNENIISVDNLTNNSVILSFNYHSSEQGISAGDSVLLRLSDFDVNKNAKIKPFAYEMLDINDDSGKKVGYMMFQDGNANNKDSLIRVVFNNAFEGKKKINGSIGVLTDLSFHKASDNESNLGIVVNNIENILTVRGPAETEENIELRFNTDINSNESRKTIVVNENDVIKQSESPKNIFNVRKNYILSETVPEKNYYILEDSIYIVKFLSKTSGEENSVSNYGLDSLMLKKDSSELNKISLNKSEFRNQRGMSIREFLEYNGNKDAFNYEKDKEGNIIGFKLNLGSLNEDHGINGEYVIMDKEGNTERVAKDRKAFGYIVYYNIAKGEKREDLGSLKLQLIDDKKEPIVNAQVEVKKDSTTVDSQTTNAEGFIEFDGLEFGNYTLSDSTGGNLNMPNVNFSVNNKNYNNLDISKSSSDISFENKAFQDNSGNVSESNVNIIEAEPIKGQVKLINKDSQTNQIISGAEFDIYSHMGFKIENASIKLTNGEAVTPKLPLGEYYLVQTNVRSGYSNAEKISFEIKSSDKIESIEIFSSSMSPVKIYNYFFDGSRKKPIEGSEFKIYSHQDLNKEIESLTTDGNGYAVSKSLPYGRYFISQTIVDSSYVLNETSVPVNSTDKKLDSSGAFLVEIENKLAGNSMIMEIPEEKIPLSPADNEAVTENVIADANSAETKPSDEEALFGAPAEKPEETQIEDDKNNPTTGDDFSILHFIFISIVMLIFIGVKFYLTKDPYKIL